VTLLETAWATA
jgi:hypothetical protein